MAPYRGRGGGSGYYGRGRGGYYGSSYDQESSGPSSHGARSSYAPRGSSNYSPRPAGGGFRRWGQPSSSSDASSPYHASSPYKHSGSHQHDSAHREHGSGENEREEGEAEDEPGQVAEDSTRSPYQSGYSGRERERSSRTEGGWDRDRERDRSSSGHHSSTHDSSHHYTSSSRYDARDRRYSERSSYHEGYQDDRAKRPRLDDPSYRPHSPVSPAFAADQPSPAKSHHSRSSREDTGRERLEERRSSNDKQEAQHRPDSREDRQKAEPEVASSKAAGAEDPSAREVAPSGEQSSTSAEGTSGGTPQANKTGATATEPSTPVIGKNVVIPTGPKAGVGRSARGGYWAVPGGGYRGGFARGRGRGRGGYVGPPGASYYGSGGFGSPTTVEEAPARSLARKKDSGFAPNPSSSHGFDNQHPDEKERAITSPAAQSPKQERPPPFARASRWGPPNPAQQPAEANSQASEQAAPGPSAPSSAAAHAQASPVEPLPASPSTPVTPVADTPGAPRKHSFVGRTQATTYNASQFSYALNPSLEAQLFTVSLQRLAGMRQLSLGKQRRDLNAALYSLQDAQLDLLAARERTKLTEAMLQQANESADIFALEQNKRENEAAAWAQQVLGTL